MNPAFSFLMPISGHNFWIGRAVQADNSQPSEGIDEPPVGGVFQSPVRNGKGKGPVTELPFSIHKGNFNHGITDASLLLSAFEMIDIFWVVYCVKAA